MWERAVHDCDSETAQKLAQALGVSVAYLYEETDELAELIQEFTRLPASEQRVIVHELKKRSAKR
ncbi:XRE family transcriptional regulator [Stenotrophomonas sp.]|jgi:NTP pyrophosphatase (non-canonical NTP hydrolase)|uniref:XRE family transcriptional regulator n=1 Tax=Stenotrophomonas sp. TaxID=69392 RepID=UPI0025D88ADD|nr:XRE family transcriptional regulator [Stenotrophomonas sp.]MBW8375277.1 XRE family transcriptional regulator [Stenotrophomonas sp.]